MRPNDRLIREIARNASEHAVRDHGRGLPRAKRRALRRRYFDSVLASLMVFDEMMAARACSQPVRFQDN
jgi:hypothetical protein